MERRDLKRVAGVVGAVVLFSVVQGCIESPSPWTTVPVDCPHTWVAEGADTLLLTVVGPQTNVPEYHDCQRFISEDGGAYGPLAAIFRADSVLGQHFAPTPFTLTPPDSGPTSDPLADTDVDRPTMPQAVNVPVIQREAARSVAVIFMIDGSYERLRLAQGFNCLYLWGPLNKLEATMVSVGDEARCADLLGVVPPQAQVQLPVNMSRIAGTEGFTREDVPPVARWDWDERHQYFISISCGDYWCEVGSPDDGLQNAGAFKGKAAIRFAAAAAAGKNRRIARVNGWYDQQHLAAPGAGPPTPTRFRGTVFPHPGLGDYDEASFATWQPVAFVALDSSQGYREKFGWQVAVGDMGAPLPVADLGGMFNMISFCRGTRERCGIVDAVPASIDCPATGESWFARSDAPGQTAEPAEPVYKCVKFRRHVHGFDVPGVVRWRWRDDDETLWARCPQGCCEYEPT